MNNAEENTYHFLIGKMLPIIIKGFFFPHPWKATTLGFYSKGY
jgi:hypothetical protein